MNYSDRYLRQIASYSPIDVMLADVAIRIQLSPTDYQLAVDHYHAINEWLEREDSPLKGYVRDFYTQGGFAIGATVARHSSDDEFDIDVMADLAFRADVDPEAALATLHDAIRGERGSRYYLKTDRKTRCSTVIYDGMHLDVTPTVRLTGTVEKTGFIFHSKPEDPSEPKMSLYANPDGFARWFIGQTPPDRDFGTFFERRSLDYDRERAILSKRADAAPVPEQCPAYQKSPAVIALQLIKRWRNLAYDKRHKNRRLPPSVLLAFYVASHANHTTSLAEELSHQVESILAIVGEAHDRGEKVFASNPMCREDICASMGCRRPLRRRRDASEWASSSAICASPAGHRDPHRRSCEAKMPDSAYRVVHADRLPSGNLRRQLNIQQICDQTAKTVDSAYRVVHAF